ncbi:DNA polymerase delta, subunit 4-domain-containing protein [Bombardia bombarda]|uniref:DNA polymerase delta, subunit 4-domain-containing protein n=1 Tax=Bombardia bombarda TaxID=252184 RepID=A0AA39XID7_9PEZI|nr:DNA polymerase delta, subunit 4-domain-containing protein [Bombardia bombarda]
MPPTRKSSRLSGGKQSTLSFNHRVTKSVPKSAKDVATKPSSSSLLPKEYKPENDDDDKVRVKPEPEADSPVDLPSPPKEEEHKLEDDLKIKTEAYSPAAAAPEKTDSELRAERISNVSIERYWSKIEASRKVRAVHKKHAEGLTTGEKVLRYFDVSSQYGPCIGNSRIKRWQRADKLGLNPPIEVLAVLLKEEAKGNAGIERAYMDELLNSTAADAV